MTAPITSNEPTTTRLHHYAGHYSKKFALHARNALKSAFLRLLGEFFRGSASGGAVLGELFRGNAVGGAVLGELFRGNAAEGAVLGEFFRANRPCAQVL